jgi:hypothetical protein
MSLVSALVATALRVLDAEIAYNAALASFVSLYTIEAERTEVAATTEHC